MLLVPIALVIVFLILAVLLRALVAPVLLIATVVLSFPAALGVGAIVFDVVFGFPGSDPGRCRCSRSSSSWRWGSTTTSSSWRASARRR